MRWEMERKDQERKKNQKLKFTPGGPTAVSGGTLNVTTAASDVLARDGRPNKKSKWDKVDVDQRTSVGRENLAAVGAHAALISAAKAWICCSRICQARS